MLVIFFLTLGFSYVNIDPDELSDNFQQSGSYIEGVRPGKETRQFLNRVVGFYGFWSAIYMMVTLGFSNLLSLFYPSLRQVAGLPAQVMIVSGILLGIVRQMESIIIQGNYKPIFSEVRPDTAKGGES